MTHSLRIPVVALFIWGTAIGYANAAETVTARTVANYSEPKAVNLDLATDDDESQAVLTAVKQGLDRRGIGVDDSSAVTLTVVFEWLPPAAPRGPSAEDAHDKATRSSPQSPRNDLEEDSFQKLNPELQKFSQSKKVQRPRRIAVRLTLYKAGSGPLSTVSVIATRNADGLSQQARGLARRAVEALGSNTAQKPDAP